MSLGRHTLIVLAFLVGIVVGGTLFSRSLPRSFMAIGSCHLHCLTQNELYGLLASAGIQRTPALIPQVEMESDECVAIRSPYRESHTHYVLFPKRDIKNIAAMTPEDAPYVIGCLSMVRDLVARAGTQKYRLTSNGPGYQEVAYLHFHVIADKD